MVSQFLCNVLIHVIHIIHNAPLCGIVDNYGYRVVLESEVRDLINASKKEYYAVRCVKDEKNVE